MADYGIQRQVGYDFSWVNTQNYYEGANQNQNAKQSGLRSSNYGDGDNLGYSVAISGNYAIAGAPYEDGSNTSASFNCGAAYIFESDGSGNWTEKRILRADNLGRLDQFGISVAISGTYAIVGASLEDSSSTSATFDCGAAYIFERDGSGNWIQKPILRASNSDGTDTFGQSVAISGNYAIVGANQEDGTSNNIANCGAAYIFERDGSGTWTEKTILRASNLDSNDNFGQAVAISGNYAIVGAHQEDGSSTHTEFNGGAAYIFERNTSGIWIEKAILRAGNAGNGDNFGYSVAISGNYVIVGAYLEDGNSDQLADSGAAYIFERDGSGIWNPNGILRQTVYKSPVAGDRYGYSVAISGNHAVVGVQYEEEEYKPVGWNSGAVYVYLRDAYTNTWTTQALYRAYNQTIGHNYGSSVAISNNQIMVGSPSYDFSSPTLPYADNTGMVYFYYVTYPKYVYDPTPVSFVGNTLTITNAISNNDIDPVSFTLNSGVTLDQLRITDLSGQYTYLSYTLKNATTGATIRSGNLINTVGYDLLLGTPLTASGITTYNLTLTSYNTFTYTIVGLLDYGRLKISWTSPTETILRASNFGQTDQFGNFVAIDGNYAIVGGLQEDGSNNTTDCGAAYIFECDNSGNFTEKKILRASNFGGTDYFGCSVAISGNYAIVGAYGEDGSNVSATFNCGAAYIFERDNSGNWTEKTILRASNFGGTDIFGCSVAISGNYAIVGAYSEDGADNTTDCGAAYIFERDTITGNWSETQILRASNFGGTDNFGRSVAISGNYAIVGANQEDGTSISATTNDCGAAYIFERNDSGNWVQKPILRASNLGGSDQFGWSVAISGNYAIVGAYSEDGTNVSSSFNCGAAYIFERDISGNWTETKILRASNFGGNDYFGYSVAISGNYAIVGANFEDGTSISATTNDCGAAYIFERDISGNWTEKKMLRASNIGANDNFGYSVAISGNYAIVGAYQEDGTNTSAIFDCGAAYIYKGEYGIDPTPLSFVNNTLTITNSIDSTDIDPVSFQLSSGASLYPFSVTSFSGTGTVSYTLTISGGATIKTGTFNANNVDLLAGVALTASGNTTYILTLTANAAIGYTIVGRILTSPTNIILSNNSVNELQPVGTTIGTLSCDNPNNAFITYSVSDTTRFSITGSTLKTNVIFDYETTSSYTVTITASIGGLTSSSSKTILVTDISGEAAELRRQNLQGSALKTAADSQTTPITATELKDASFNATELKAAVYSAVQLKAASFTAVQLKDASFNATELKDASFTIIQLKDASFNAVQLKDASFNATELKDASFNAAELKAASFTAAELKDASFTVIQLKDASFNATELKDASFTVIQLKDASFNAAELKAASFTAAELKTASFTVIQLKDASFTAAQLKDASFTVIQLKDASFNATELKAASFTATELKDASFTVIQLKDASFTAAQLKDASFTVIQLKDASFNAVQLKDASFTVIQLKDASFNATELKAALFNAVQLKDASFNATELKDASFNATELKDASFTATELKDASFTATDLKTASFTATELKDASFTATDLKTASFTATELKDASFNATELKTALFTATDLKDASFNATQLKDVGFTATEMKSSFNATELKTGGYDATELIDGGFLLTELKTAAFTAKDLKDANVLLADLINIDYNATELNEAAFTATELKASGEFTIDDLKTGGFTAAEMKTAQYDATQLKTVGYSATEMKDAAFTATELNNVGYTPLQLVFGGFNSSSLIILGIVADWNIIDNANCLTTSYVQDFVDVSGCIILRENANLHMHGKLETAGNLLLNRLFVTADASFNRRIFVGGDVSMNGKVAVSGDIYMNGNVTKCSFNNSSIPKSAVAGAVPDGPNYTTSKIVYDQKFQANADVSMNGPTLAANNVKVSGNIVFGDGTVMNTYDNNVLTTNPKVFNSSTFTSLDICGNLVAGSYATSSDYRIKTNIVELDETYTVDKLRPVKYYQTQINREKYGLIAHELQEHYPDLVIGEKDGSELQRVNYMGLIAILINEIKRMKRELSELETDVTMTR